MSTVIFRKGKSKKYNGVVCDYKLVDAEQLYAYLADGWTVNIDEVKEEEETVKEEGRPLDSVKFLEKVSAKKILTINDKVIRKIAKDLKIKDWENKTIKTLKNNIIALKEKLENKEKNE